MMAFISDQKMTKNIQNLSLMLELNIKFFVRLKNVKKEIIN